MINGSFDLANLLQQECKRIVHAVGAAELDSFCRGYGVLGLQEAEKPAWRMDTRQLHKPAKEMFHSFAASENTITFLERSKEGAK
jgi:hypothetical protein